MKKITTLLMLALLCHITQVHSQQFFQYRNFLNQAIAINPAVAGTVNGLPLTLTHRSQWSGMEGAPTTQILTLHGPVNSYGGLGIAILNDQTGPASQFGAQLAYAYRLKLNEDYLLSFGIAPMIIQHNLDKNALTTDEAGDPLMQALNEKSLTVDMNAGWFLYSRKVTVGMAMPQLLKSPLYFGEELITAKLHRHYLLTASYRYDLNETWTFIGSGITRYTYAAPIQGDLSVRAMYKEQLWLSAGGRGSTANTHGEALLLQAGIIHGAFTAGYAFDFHLSALQDGTAGSHEVLFRYNLAELCNKKESRQ